MAIPGQAGGAYLASGIAHDSLGRPTLDSALHQEMLNKHFKKLEPLGSRADLVLKFGDKKAKNAIITWGSSAKETLKVFQQLQVKKLRVLQQQ